MQRKSWFGFGSISRIVAGDTAKEEAARMNRESDIRRLYEVGTQLEVLEQLYKPEEVAKCIEKIEQERDLLKLIEETTLAEEKEKSEREGKSECNHEDDVQAVADDQAKHEDDGDSSSYEDAKEGLGQSDNTGSVADGDDEAARKRRTSTFAFRFDSMGDGDENEVNATVETAPLDGVSEDIALDESKAIDISLDDVNLLMDSVVVNDDSNDDPENDNAQGQFGRQDSEDDLLKELLNTEGEESSHFDDSVTTDDGMFQDTAQEAHQLDPGSQTSFQRTSDATSLEELAADKAPLVTIDTAAMGEQSAMTNESHASNDSAPGLRERTREKEPDDDESSGHQPAETPKESAEGGTECAGEVQETQQQDADHSPDTNKLSSTIVRPDEAVSEEDAEIAASMSQQLSLEPSGEEGSAEISESLSGGDRKSAPSSVITANDEGESPSKVDSTSNDRDQVNQASPPEPEVPAEDEEPEMLVQKSEFEPATQSQVEMDADSGIEEIEDVFDDDAMDERENMEMISVEDNEELAEPILQETADVVMKDDVPVQRPEAMEEVVEIEEVVMADDDDGSDSASEESSTPPPPPPEVADEEVIEQKNVGGDDKDNVVDDDEEVSVEEASGQSVDEEYEEEEEVVVGGDTDEVEEVVEGEVHDEVVTEEVVLDVSSGKVVDEEYEEEVDEEEVILDETSGRVVEEEYEEEVDGDDVEEVEEVEEIVEGQDGDDEVVTEEVVSDEDSYADQVIESWAEVIEEEPEDLEAAITALIAVVYKGEDVDVESMIRRTRLPELYKYLKQQYWYKIHTNKEDAEQEAKKVQQEKPSEIVSIDDMLKSRLQGLVANVQDESRRMDESRRVSVHIQAPSGEQGDLDASQSDLNPMQSLIENVRMSSSRNLFAGERRGSGGPNLMGDDGEEEEEDLLPPTNHVTKDYVKKISSTASGSYHVSRDYQKAVNNRVTAVPSNRRKEEPIRTSKQTAKIDIAPPLQTVMSKDSEDEEVYEEVEEVDEVVEYIDESAAEVGTGDVVEEVVESDEEIMEEEIIETAANHSDEEEEVVQSDEEGEEEVIGESDHESVEEVVQSDEEGEEEVIGESDHESAEEIIGDDGNTVEEIVESETEEIAQDDVSC